MAGKKRTEIQLQAIINSQSQWDDMLQNKGLTVIDVYQAWCGPCKAMQPLFRKLKNELNEDEILHFVVAEADSIVTLQSFRDKCEPLFLFSLNGKIVAKVQGANAPLVNRKVISLINEERKILDGEMVRPQYNEIPLSDTLEEDSEGLNYDSIGEKYNIAVIKPDAVNSRKGLQIKTKIANAGYDIEAEEKKIFTEEEVKTFFGQMAEEPDFEEFLSLMTTGLSYMLVISMGTEDQDSFGEISSQTMMEAKESSDSQNESESQPTSRMIKKKRDSLQEYLERQRISQFCEVEDTPSNVTKFLDTFFPNFKAMQNIKLQRTLALLRPDLLQYRKDDVLSIIKKEGFKILMQRQLVLSEEEAKTLCKEYESEDYYEKLIPYMTSGPSLALVLLRENGLEYWKQLLGPKSLDTVSEYVLESLCAQFATEELPINQLYGSNSIETAEEEIEHFFPLTSTLAVIKPHVSREQREEILKIIKDSGFDLTMMKELILSKEDTDKIYFTITGKDFYKDVVAIFAEGPSWIMVLTKWNAVSDWRQIMGPVNPEEAKLLSPDSLRAKYGINILRNAVHGSSNDLDATMSIDKIFETDSPEIA
ncbi:thioredoxin domain-containing protein 3 [Perognathus longimembris pacificus]|uniref:thioredoxin domain-containing protein 3 n=1 Tax=Perognathus longimembris pacificus TaxID=214514 RepID=UPI002019930B|nr:thioredoxin domain-containing protein 3 [Perognathus longimembris pacificus]